MTELEKSIKRLEQKFSEKIEEVITPLKEDLTRFELTRSKVETHVNNTIRDVQKMSQELERFYLAINSMESSVSSIPETVEAHLEGSLSRNMIKLSEHIFEEMRSASRTYSDELRSVASRYEKAVDRLDTRLGWRAYVPPLMVGLGSFFLAFSLVWWLDIGVAKIDPEDMASLQKLRNYFDASSPEDQKKIIEIFKKTQEGINKTNRG